MSSSIQQRIKLIESHRNSRRASNEDTFTDTPMRVRELPAYPKADGQYVFDSVSRKDVTERNHGLHKYPAKFIPQIPRWGLTYPNQTPYEVVLDPFCGSGTTLTEAGLLGKHAIGFDISPLAVLISRAKTTCFQEGSLDAEQIKDKVVSKASKIYLDIMDALRDGEECLGLHRTWSFWFRPFEMSRLLALKRAIVELYKNRNPELMVFLLACLSSIAKASSYLNEDQIKVRYDGNKQPSDPFKSFSNFSVQAIRTQQQLSQLFRSTKSQFTVEVGTAAKLPLDDSCVDRVITSPPYINAVDYTMAHKYNLFILGLIEPSNFKEHCREYIGLTERAVRAADLTSEPVTGVEVIDEQIVKLWALDTPVSRNRAFVVHQYFTGMQNSLKELFRVVRTDGKAIFVVGSTNRICGLEIKTASILEKIAHIVGFKTELRYFHELANRSSMRLNRASTGGKVNTETIYVFSKP